MNKETPDLRANGTNNVRAAKVPPNNDLPVVASVFIIIIGVLLLTGCGILTSFDVAKSKKCSETVNAVIDHIIVEEHISTKGDHKTNYYSPVLRYTYNGEEYYTRAGSSPLREYDEGEEIAVRLDPNDPKKLLMPSDIPDWTLNITLGGLGVLAIAAGALILKDNKKKMENSEKI